MNEPAAILNATNGGAHHNSAAVLDVKIDRFSYGRNAALRNVHLKIPKNRITAFIGPSGCGKSTTLRCLNRMHPQKRTKLEGQILFDNQNLYDATIDPRMVRIHIGMVFQQPNPFHLSVFDNVAFGLRLNGVRDNVPERVENALRQAALWDDVKDRLEDSGTALSGGQQQRLCIARAIAVEPRVLLMDEPCSALDPISTGKIESLILELKKRFTIVIVTHNLGQATRISDDLAYFFVERDKESRFGRLLEYGPTQELVDNPKSESLRSYLGGKIG
jgi:phosphate transport system ATP-binding protein